jgi:hypothetical protein
MCVMSNLILVRLETMLMLVHLEIVLIMSNLILDYLETLLVSVKDRCTVCAKHTIGS